MRAVLFSSLVVLLLSDRAIALGPAVPGPRAVVRIRNETNLPVTVRVIPSAVLRDILEPGDVKSFTVAGGSPFTVTAAVRLGVGPLEELTLRRYSAPPGSCSQITITRRPLSLSPLSPCEPGDGGLPQAASHGRESVLLAFSSTGLIALAAVGLLINRHE